MKDKLIHMRDKLNDISKRNRSIRLLKIYNKWSFDLTELDKLSMLSKDKESEKIVEKIISQSKGEITLLKPTLDNEHSMIISKKLTDLSRNMKAIEEESGIHDFYLGYPFLTGTLADGTFFQAPLFLYPIRIEKNNLHAQKWILRIEEGSPQINRTLFLAFKKLNNIDFSEEFFEAASVIAGKQDVDEWRSFLQDHEMKVSFAKQGLTRLKEYRREDIPEKQGISIVEYAVMGNFPQGGSALVKDYDSLIHISEEEDLSLVSELIDPKELDFEEGLNLETEYTQEKIEVLNLLDTDGSQEEILKEARYKKGIVVHGPPGTGKSQVIVNLITDAISQDKRVLVVCQKRAALDVVYQRLDGLSLTNHIALVHDEKNDRKSLYSKVGSVLEQNKVMYEQASHELHSTSKRLETHEKLLNDIAKGLYEYQDFGYRLYDLYGKAASIGEFNQILDLKPMLSEFHKDTLEDIYGNIYTYAEWQERFGDENYALKNRKSFAAFSMKEKVELDELLNDLIKKAKQSSEYLHSLDYKKITPAYTWLIENKLDKIYPDLEDNNKKTLQGLRIWWWTSFSGKTIIEELLEGEKFKGTSSTEWLKIKQSLIVMNHLGKETKKMADEMEKLKEYFDDKYIDSWKNRIADGYIPIQELDKMLEYIYQDFDSLQQMDAYWNQCSEVVKKILTELQTKSSSSESSLPNYWVQLFKYSTFIHWIDKTESKYPEVKKISTNEFNRTRETFAKLVEEKRELANKYLIHQLTQSVDSLLSNYPKAMRDLKYQVGKKRQVWPLRKLVNEFADKGLVGLMPVWLTSPETVSSIFPLKENLFDLVIFDEASQCTVESGIPAVHRGKQVIIAGDEKQLPPFNMFQSSFVNEEDEEEYDTDESQSLLNLAKRRFPEKILQWHYRSKYEELINFSNHAFYNGHVQIAPNVAPLKNPPSISWKKVDGRWLNQSNEVEALEVVRILKESLTKQPDKSVGIITFNAKQQTKILDMIEKNASDDQEFNAVYNQVMAKELDERVFVKNIENVQGDERDIIIFSIGYAKNEEGRIYNRFGMLNQQGGENRLNVAVSRAKEGITVVSSIEPEELNVSNTAQIGPKLLKSYMKYVKAVSNTQIEYIHAVVEEINENVSTHVKEQGLHFDSPFEEQVYKQLRNLGYEVTTQVGMSGYRIDMAIVHPNDSSKYILGIECDGAMYHSTANAKERDIYRQRFLESRGWTIERIWSRNWWKTPSAEIERIDQKVKELLKQEELKKKVKNG
ncbi:AAA domain-containing protein [Niallia alba]|uniref:AAA domain-containing protein n=1 Tax=Niallia alba TaxID=2729105 RepID=UPI0039A129EB